MRSGRNRQLSFEDAQLTQAALDQLSQALPDKKRAEVMTAIQATVAVLGTLQDDLAELEGVSEPLVAHDWAQEEDDVAGYWEIVNDLLDQVTAVVAELDYYTSLLEQGMDLS